MAKTAKQKKTGKICVYIICIYYLITGDSHKQKSSRLPTIMEGKKNRKKKKTWSMKPWEILSSSSRKDQKELCFSFISSINATQKNHHKATFLGGCRQLLLVLVHHMLVGVPELLKGSVDPYVNPGSPSWQNLAPKGRIRNPWSMDHPKHPVFVWSTGLPA